eukprot:CAMPEP_0183434546 /NCGR_PEP_ID=MMETSP0370-20130417/63642_1 /TAXON_ID=268820 /ORGANISM="Peridinium aciculiferum, Strain PAER-2" /LENGTH=220 /DNA_ID=CAMNT_0025621253 /DNA_START=27 /DNA_END=690 /DNA_ORIENTATION=+
MASLSDVPSPQSLRVLERQGVRAPARLHHKREVQVSTRGLPLRLAVPRKPCGHAGGLRLELACALAPQPLLVLRGLLLHREDVRGRPLHAVDVLHHLPVMVRMRVHMRRGQARKRELRRDHVFLQGALVATVVNDVVAYFWCSSRAEAPWERSISLCFPWKDCSCAEMPWSMPSRRMGSAFRFEIEYASMARRAAPGRQVGPPTEVAPESNTKAADQRPS